jgi:hypothetical protein
VQVFEKLLSQGVPFDYRGLGTLHVHCYFGVPHGHCGFVFLSPWSCVFHWLSWFCVPQDCHGVGVFFDHYGLVYLMVTMVLPFS